MTQCDRMLKIMLKDKKRKWKAIDFQFGENFIGYEASARMSDLVRMYPDLFIVEKVGRFRTLKINTKNKKLIKEIKERIK